MQHPSPTDPDDPEPDPDLDDLALGTPLYQGTGLSVRALSAKDLAAFLDAHAQQPTRRFGAGWDQPTPTPPGATARGSAAPAGRAGAGWPAPVLADLRRTPRCGYGTPGRSAQAMYRRERARVRAAWARTLPWRAAVVLAAVAGGAVLTGAAGLRGAVPLLAGLAGGVVVGWRLRFQVSRDTRAWRDGARGERATARLLRRLACHGYAVFHDVAIPGTSANGDHVVISPGGVVLVDSKRYSGRVWQGPDGRVWHNQYSMDQPLRSLRMEAAAIADLLGVPVRPLVCVHGAHVDFAGLTVGDVEIVPAGRLCTVLAARGAWPRPTDVGALTIRAHIMLRPA